MKIRTKCPYSVSDVCYRNGCIYLPKMDCIKEWEQRDKIRNARNKKFKKGFKHYER